MSLIAELIIECLSDTCFAMPAASDASIDVNAAYDKAGLPMVSGKTLHGLLRDTWLSVRDVPGWADSADSGYALLGREKTYTLENLVRIGDGRIDADTQAWVEWALTRRDHKASRADILDGFYTTRTLTAVDALSGAPQTETLRVVRVIPAGTVLHAPITAAQALTEAQWLLLARLAKLTRHVGIDRNRGLGHVRMELCRGKADEPIAQQTTATSGSTFMPVRLRLTAPCLIADRSTDPNSRTTRRYVTGAAIRGAVAAQLERLGGQAELRELILSGKVRFLNGYIEQDGRRSLPTPCTWQRNKDACYDDWNPDAEAADAVSDLLEPAQRTERHTQREPVHFRYWTSDRSGRMPASVEIRQTTHQNRHRASGVPRQDNNDVFVYEAIEAGQTFVAVVAAEGDAAHRLARIRELLSGPLWLGRSMRSGYGGAPDVSFDLARFDAGTEAGKLPADLKEGEQFTVLLTSDALLRDPQTGQYDPWRLHAALEHAFRGMATVLGACVCDATLEAHNRTWRCQMPAVPVAAAGSYAMLQADKDLSGAELASVQARPIGERIAEGCGCFVVLDGPGDKLDIRQSKQHEPGVPQAAEPTALVAAQQRIYRTRLKELLADAAVSLAHSKATTHIPSAALLHRLRIPLRAEAGWRQEYTTWLSPGERALKQPANDAIRRCIVGGRTLRDILAQAARGQVISSLPADRTERASAQITSSDTAQRIWTEEEARLQRFYLDTLLSMLAKRARRLQGASRRAQ